MKQDKECITLCCSKECPERVENAGKRILLGSDERVEWNHGTVMTRLSDDDLNRIDALVETEVFGSRSEAAAFFIEEGIQARRDLFDEVMPALDKIRELKEHAKGLLVKETPHGGVHA